MNSRARCRNPASSTTCTGVPYSSANVDSLMPAIASDPSASTDVFAGNSDSSAGIDGHVAAPCIASCWGVAAEEPHDELLGAVHELEVPTRHRDDECTRYWRASHRPWAGGTRVSSVPYQTIAGTESLERSKPQSLTKTRSSSSQPSTPCRYASCDEALHPYRVRGASHDLAVALGHLVRRRRVDWSDRPSRAEGLLRPVAAARVGGVASPAIDQVNSSMFPWVMPASHSSCGSPAAPRGATPTTQATRVTRSGSRVATARQCGPPPEPPVTAKLIDAECIGDGRDVGGGVGHRTAGASRRQSVARAVEADGRERRAGRRGRACPVAARRTGSRACRECR